MKIKNILLFQYGFIFTNIVRGANIKFCHCLGRSQLFCAINDCDK